jgi:hypothetical protein
VRQRTSHIALYHVDALQSNEFENSALASMRQFHGFGLSTLRVITRGEIQQGLDRAVPTCCNQNAVDHERFEVAWSHRSSGKLTDKRDPDAPRTTITALKRGYLNALNCGLFFVGAWLLVGGMIAVVTGRERGDSLWTSFALLVGVILFTFVLTWLWTRNAGGRVLIDCGPHPTRWLLLFEAGLFALLGASGSLPLAGSLMAPRVASAFFGLVFGVFWLVMATGRLRLREGGLWQY